MNGKFHLQFHRQNFHCHAILKTSIIMPAAALRQNFLSIIRPTAAFLRQWSPPKVNHYLPWCISKLHGKSTSQNRLTLQILLQFHLQNFHYHAISKTSIIMPAPAFRQNFFPTFFTLTLALQRTLGGTSERGGQGSRKPLPSRMVASPCLAEASKCLLPLFDWSAGVYIIISKKVHCNSTWHNRAYKGYKE